jgi:hypothetical protein
MTDRSDAARSRSRLRQPARLLFLVTAIGVLSMPVSYRGGAEQVHPHAFIQLWIDAEHGSFDHHHGGAANAANHRGHDENNAADMPEEGTSPVSVEPGKPLLSPPTAPETHDLTLVALAMSALALCVVGSSLVGRLCRVTGRTIRPDIPPPRPSIREWRSGGIGKTERSSRRAIGAGGWRVVSCGTYDGSAWW